MSAPPRLELKHSIPYGRQDISQADVDAVVEVLRSDWLTQGPAVERFEGRIASACGAQHAVAVCNGTAALHLACLALGLGPGDRLWTSPISFVASANCALYCGAEADFVDIDPRTYNISVAALKEKLEVAARDGRLPKAVVVVHFSGQPCEMEEIGALARTYGFAVIEDAAHALGAEYRGGRIGGCRHSEMTIFSLHPVKIITTGEGGVVLTNREDLRTQLALLRTHGITRDEKQMAGGSEGPWYYEQLDLGYNYRLTDIQAALGYSQMQRLEAFLARRRQLAARYDELLQGLPVILPWQHPDGRSARHLYVIRLDPREATKSRKEVVEQMRASGVQVNVHYIPVHLQPYYRAKGFKRGDFPCAERYYDNAVSLPLYAALGDEEQDYVVATLRKILGTSRRAAGAVPGTAQRPPHPAGS
ncbi:MAG: UDP-4-amino-4,6-dideoxy-N-acetyl-beta-L-altrosamine transaminase [Acidobacteriota bacterium]|nr:UDP-4-amino-4,6-dideoxy-N-acetyl-beta-L-altrosamine transaminase [Acidobacteriota bacterium]